MKAFDDEHLGYIRDCIEYTKTNSRPSFEAYIKTLAEGGDDSDHIYAAALLAEKGLDL
jgi:hypothetical protein